MRTSLSLLLSGLALQACCFAPTATPAPAPVPVEPVAPPALPGHCMTASIGVCIDEHEDGTPSLSTDCGHYEVFGTGPCPEVGRIGRCVQPTSGRTLSHLYPPMADGPGYCAQLAQSVYGVVFAP